MKTCFKCKELKPFTEFHKGKSEFGLHSWCRKCVSDNRSQAYKDNPESRHRDRWWNLYRLRREDISQLLNNQNNACKICKVAFTDEKPFRVDHDHSCCSGVKSCGKCVRGLLCGSCNTRLGWFEARSDNILNYLS